MGHRMIVDETAADAALAAAKIAQPGLIHKSRPPDPRQTCPAAADIPPRRTNAPPPARIAGVALQFRLSTTGEAAEPMDRLAIRGADFGD